MARYQRARGYARRGYSGAKRGYRAAGRSYGGKVGLNVSPAFLAGVVTGYTNLDDKLPGQLVLGAAVAPVNGLGVVKGFAQGVIAGNLVQTLMKTGVSKTGYQSMVTL